MKIALTQRWCKIIFFEKTFESGVEEVSFNFDDTSIFLKNFLKNLLALIFSDIICATYYAKRKNFIGSSLGNIQKKI